MRLRQAIQLTGLDTHKYKTALEGIAAIHSTFTKYMRSDKLQVWTPDTFREWSAVSVGNRYFSTGAIAASAEAVPFNNLVDPDGVLATVDSDKYRHTVDNDVGYFERQKKDDGGFRYVFISCIHKQFTLHLYIRYTLTSPTNISIGDIVEARLSFLAAPVTTGYNDNANKDFKLVIVLRSLALIDNTFTKVQAHCHDCLTTLTRCN